MIKQKRVDDDVRKMVDIEKAWRVSVSKKKGGGEEEGE